MRNGTCEKPVRVQFAKLLAIRHMVLHFSPPNLTRGALAGPPGPGLAFALISPLPSWDLNISPFPSFPAECSGTSNLDLIVYRIYQQTQNRDFREWALHNSAAGLESIRSSQCPMLGF